MIGSVQQISKSMEGKKTAAEREELMSSLEGELNKKATVLSNVTADVSKKQQQQDEEYMLGLLIMHQKDWSLEKQLNATATFMHTSPVLRSLYRHHNAVGPLAPQLAALMDAESNPARDRDARKMSKAAVLAAHVFIQLRDSFK
eukprot:TRINITY_DN13392_c0_g1_i1.p1 TRINITY_DN13392_c0_g1~~TRINITY_DN13392_c0_g1_i1.p1  ORF type:complete len:144 (-),score=38.46 TRINITY_DN13392_c0_g1_i1:76-507(-)